MSNLKPMNEYQCDYPNEIHQLLVAVSKNYYVGKDGDIKYQKKPLPFDLKTVDKSAKTRIIHYIIRDHFSGFYYAEMCKHTDKINIGRFLYNAWSKKPNYEFCGVPTGLIIPNIVKDIWPSVKEIVKKFGIKSLNPKSGFAAGTIETRYWQKAIKYYIYSSEFTYGFVNKNFEWLQSKNIEMCIHANKTKFDYKESRFDKWINNIEKVYVPKDLSSFILTSI